MVGNVQKLFPDRLPDVEVSNGTIDVVIHMQHWWTASYRVEEQFYPTEGKLLYYKMVFDTPHDVRSYIEAKEQMARAGNVKLCFHNRSGLPNNLFGLPDES
jgi:hypothetical protein